MLVPAFGILVFVLVGGVLVAFVALYRGRTRGYVMAVVDTVHTANIGHGSNIGIAFVQAPGTRQVTGIVAERGRKADIRIRPLRGGRFAVKDKSARRIVSDGEPIVVADSAGGRRALVLRAFDTNPASRVASRR